MGGTLGWSPFFLLLLVPLALGPALWTHWTTPPPVPRALTAQRTPEGLTWLDASPEPPPGPHTLRWDALVEVQLLTTEDGPWDEDLFWVLRAEDGPACTLGATLADALDLLPLLQQLPRFDHAAVVEAMGRTDRHRVTVWRGAVGEGEACYNPPLSEES